MQLFQDATWVTSEGVQTGELWIGDDGRLDSLTTARIARSIQVIDASQWVFYPGLINAHDHLEFNHYPRTRWRERYANASQWAADMQPHLEEEPFVTLRKIPLEERCWVGGLKNLLSGVTTVAHHNPLHPPLKKPVFPVEVYQPYGWAHSLYLTSRWEMVKEYHLTRQGKFILHLAEGTDDAANAEILTLEKWGCLSQKTVLIHGVGLHGQNLGLAIEKSGGLVWCPSSNEFLLGQTAQVQAWYAAGKLALGSDSLLTADGNLLDELRAAKRAGQFTDEQLFHLVTDDAARLLGRLDIGDLKAGRRADILALRKPDHQDYYRALVEAQLSDIAWVMRGGQRLWSAVGAPNCQVKGVAYHLHKTLLAQLSPWVAQQLEIDF